MAYSSISLIEAELLLSSGSLSSSSVPTSTIVSSWLEEADSLINDKTGNVYASTAETSVEFDWEGNDNILRVDPFSAVTSLWYSSEAKGETPDWTLKTVNEDYFIHGEQGEIEINYNKFLPIKGKRRFMLSYTTGQATVPAKVRTIATKITANRIVSATVANQASEQSGGSVQVGTIKIEDPTAFSVSAYKSRALEVKDFFLNDLGTFKAHRVSRAYDLD